MIYWLLGHAGKHRPAYSAPDVDRLDVSVVATLLGIRAVGNDDPFGPLSGDFQADSNRLIARRLAEARKKQRDEAASDSG